MAETLLFLVEPGKEWIGGVYYVRNVLKTLSAAPWMQAKRIHVLVRPEFREVFAPLAEAFPHFTLHERRTEKPSWERFTTPLLRPLKHFFDAQIASVSREIRADVIFPVMDCPFLGARGLQIRWMPDFQDLRYPQFFTAQELERRVRIRRQIIRSRAPLLLSSRSAADDWENCSGGRHGPVSVLPFISDIEESISQLTPDQERQYLSELGLWRDGAARDYFYVANQFWPHKNHRLILDAFDLLKAQGAELPLVVCTGNTEDPRSRKPFEELSARLEASGYREHFRILSMVRRPVQLTVMRHARAVLQPSLFEGWNTGVQEAARLGRPLLLSDLPVHHEQGDLLGASFFDPDSPEALAQLLREYPAAPVMDKAQLQRRSLDMARIFAEGARDFFE